MNRFFYLIIVLLTWYVAGMYRSMTILVLTLAELFLFFLMFPICLYFRRHVRLSLLETAAFIHTGEKHVIRLRAENRGSLPISRFLVKADFLPHGANQGSPFEIRLIRQHLTYIGSMDIREDRTLLLPMFLPHLGIWNITIYPAFVYDYFSLYRLKAGERQTLRVYVLPDNREADISLPPEMPREELSDENRSKKSALPPDIRDFREYAPGDSIRRIHWPMSVRTADLDQLYVREYEENAGSGLSLYINRRVPEDDTAARRNKSLRKRLLWDDEFYAGLFSVLLGLLTVRDYLFVSAGGSFRSRIVTDREEAERVLTDLYELEEAGEAPQGDGSGQLVFGRDLCLRAGDLVLYRIDPPGKAGKTGRKQNARKTNP